MVAFLVTVLAILLLVGIIYLLLQEPQLLAAGSAIAIGVIFATLPLVVTMAPFFGAIVFGAGAVAITYGVMSINAYRRTQELRRELAIRQVRATMRPPSQSAGEVSVSGQPVDPEDELEQLERERLARASKRSGLPHGGGEGADVGPARTASRAARARRPNSAGFEEELARLERSGSSGRSSKAGGLAAMERSSSLARLARRRS